MPVSLNHLNWEQLNTNPALVRNCLTSLKAVMKEHPRQFETQYEQLLNLMTLQTIQAIKKIDRNWCQLIDTTTDYYHQLVQQRKRLPYLDEYIINHVNDIFDPIRKTTLSPIDDLSLDFIKQHRYLFHFSFQIFDEIAEQNLDWETLKDLPDSMLKDLMDDDDPDRKYLKQFAEHRFALHSYQDHLIKIVIDQRFNHYPKPNDEFNQMINHHYVPSI